MDTVFRVWITFLNVLSLTGIVLTIMYVVRAAGREAREPRDGE